MSNILGKLKTMMSGSESDAQYYEEELGNENEEIMEESNTYNPPIPPESETVKSSRRTNRREKSNYSMDLPSDNSLNLGFNSNVTPNNVIEMPGMENAINEVVIIEPLSFNEIPKVIQTLRERRCVVLNLNVMNPEEAQRAVDFVAGGTFAIDGNQERIGECIFLFTPKTVKVSNWSANNPQKESAQNNQPRQPFSDSLWDNHTSSLSQ